MKTIRMGILGCGPRGMQMARITKLLPEFYTLTCMSDMDETALEEAGKAFPDIRLFRSSDELLDSGLADAVITEVPPDVHMEYVAKALDRNLHVLGEIPAVNSIEEGQILWEKVNSSKALYMAGSNPNYREKSRLLYNLLQQNKIGKVAYIETEYIHDSTRMKDAWRKEYEACRYCTHSLAPILKLIGSELRTVCCMSTYDRLKNGHRHNAMSALYSTKDNLVVRLLTAFAIPYSGPPHTTKIYAENGVLELYNDKARVWLPEDLSPEIPQSYEEIIFGTDFTYRPADLKIIDEDLFRQAHYGHNGSDLFMLMDFADAVLNNKPSPIGVKDALMMTLPGIYAAESAREGGALKTIRYPWD